MEKLKFDTYELAHEKYVELKKETDKLINMYPKKLSKEEDAKLLSLLCETLDVLKEMQRIQYERIISKV